MLVIGFEEAIQMLSIGLAMGRVAEQKRTLTPHAQAERHDRIGGIARTGGVYPRARWRAHDLIADYLCKNELRMSSETISTIAPALFVRLQLQTA